jgi:hypothetical protein
MHLIAHHAGEQALAPLLLLAGGGLSLLVAIGRAQLAAARDRLTRRLRKREHRPRDAKRSPGSGRGGWLSCTVASGSAAHPPPPTAAIGGLDQVAEDVGAHRIGDLAVGGPVLPGDQPPGSNQRVVRVHPGPWRPPGRVRPKS